MSSSQPTDLLLRVDNLSKSFKGLRALDGYHIELPAQRIHGVIGPNGAGKTTLFNLLTGFIKPTTGTIVWQGQNITGASTAHIARIGMVRTFQNIRLFDQMTAIQNVKVALQNQRVDDSGEDSMLFAANRFVNTLFSTSRFYQRESALDVGADGILEIVGLTARRDQIAASLPYGDQRKLEIARALALKPELLLLDEPTAGMNPQETNQVLSIIRRLRDEFHVTILLIAHDIPLVMNVCERIQVLNYGQILAEGDPHAVRNNPDVIAAYLGTSYAQSS